MKMFFLIILALVYANRKKVVVVGDFALGWDPNLILNTKTSILSYFTKTSLSKVFFIDPSSRNLINHKN
jgi:hypothetical protein